MVEEFSKWTPATPPLSGKFLKDNHCPDGVIMGRVRQELVTKWIDSSFQLQQDDLGKLIPQVLDNLKDFIASIKEKQSSGKRKFAKN